MHEARLLEDDGSPAGAGRSVNFELGTQTCTGATDATGTASRSLVVNQSSGPKSLLLDFSGDAYAIWPTSPRSAVESHRTIGSPLTGHGTPAGRPEAGCASFGRCDEDLPPQLHGATDLHGFWTTFRGRHGDCPRFAALSPNLLWHTRTEASGEKPAPRPWYPCFMRSVADALRLELHRRIAALTAEERIALTARLAEDDLLLFRRARGCSVEEARRVLESRRQSGRRFSRVANPAA